MKPFQVIRTSCWVIAALILLLLSTPLLALGKKQPTPQPVPSFDVSADAAAQAEANAAAVAAAIAAQEQSQQQSQVQKQESTQTNEQSIVNWIDPEQRTNVSTEVKFRGRSSIDTTASAIPPNVTGAHSCAYGGSLGIGITGFNASGGRQKIDPRCEARQLASIAYSAGEKYKGDMAWCFNAVQIGVFETQDACMATNPAVIHFAVHMREQALETCAKHEPGTIIREVQDDGLMYIYECTEKEVIGKGQ